MIKLLNSSCPQGNFGGNQLQDGSGCPSLPHRSTTDGFHVNIAVLTLVLFLKTTSKTIVDISAYVQALTFLELENLPHLTLHTCSTSWHVFQEGRTKPYSEKRTQRIEAQTMNCHFNDLASERGTSVMHEPRT